MTKLAPEWVRTSDPVIRSPARYRWTTAAAAKKKGNQNRRAYLHWSKKGYPTCQNEWVLKIDPLYMVLIRVLCFALTE